MTQHGAEREVAELVVVSREILHEDILDRPVVIDDTAHALAVRVVFVVVGVVVNLRDVGIDRRFEGELVLVLERSVKIPQITHVLDIGRLLVENLHRVVKHQLVGTAHVIVAVGFVGTVEGPLLDAAPDDGRAGVGSRNLVVLDIVARNVGADFEPRREFMADFHLEVHLLHLVGADHARLVVVIGADIISGLDVAARKRHVAVIERSGLENQIHPVRVGQRAERILNMLLETRIPRFVAVLAVVVVDAFVEIADIKPRIGHFDLPHVGEAGDSGVEVEMHLRFALLARLGGDNDHAVVGARTVNGRRSGVFQHLDRLDVADVERRQRRHVLAEIDQIGVRVGDRNAVDHIEGFVARAQRRRSADHHPLAAAQVTRTGRSRHAGHTAAEQLRRAGDLPHVRLVHLHLADGAGHQRTALGAVADDHDLFQLGCVLAERQGQHRLGSERDGLGRIADERHAQHLSFAGLDGKTAVDIGADARSRSPYDDARADHRISRSIDDASGIPLSGRR